MQGQKQNIKTNGSYFLTLTVLNWIVELLTKSGHNNMEIKHIFRF